MYSLCLHLFQLLSLKFTVQYDTMQRLTHCLHGLDRFSNMTMQCTFIIVDSFDNVFLFIVKHVVMQK